MELPDRFASGPGLDLVAESLADPTRRSIFRHITAANGPQSAAEVAEVFRIHRTVARSHLEQLVDSGLLCSRSHRQASKGGRPPKIYYPSAQRIDLQVPARQYEILSGLLVEALSRFGDAAGLMLREIGLEFGRRLSQQAGDGWEARLGVMAESGAGVELIRPDAEHLDLEVRNCLFREISHKADGLVCGLDHAIFEGLLGGTEGEFLTLEEAERRTSAKDICRLRFRVRKPGREGPGHEDSA